ncbi:hypothetical protein P8452_21944 [Trifolium repens]|nr:hypothetical protein P8452_21944 [Trifolium repens]
MEERVGSSLGEHRNPSSEVLEFCKFVEDLELVDLPILGRRFTWYHASGLAMSRIDRMLISDEWALRWGNVALWALHRDVSDHFPLLTKYSHEDWGPRPFRFNNFWLEHKFFKGVVEACWGSTMVDGWMGFVLKEKLKSLKLVLRQWHKEEFGALDTKIEALKVNISDLDVRGELTGLSTLEVESRKQKFNSLWSLLRSKKA